MSFYDDLQLSTDATADEIKKAYRKLAKKHHPDKGGCEDQFKRITRAYEILADPDKRKRYDNGEDVEDYISPSDKAVQNLCRIFDTVVSQHGFMPDHTDLVRRMREEINERTIEMERDVAEVGIDIATIKTVLKRLKKADFLLPHVETTLSAMKVRLGQIKEAIKIQDIMLERLEPSSYEFDIDDDMEWAQGRELEWES